MYQTITDFVTYAPLHQVLLVPCVMFVLVALIMVVLFGNYGLLDTEPQSRNHANGEWKARS